MASTFEGRRDWLNHWNGVAKRAGPEEFLRQVERTVGGKPTNDLQIALDVRATCQALELNVSDCLLDLCCGNGLVTFRLASVCQSVYAVDFSIDLIMVARRHHAAPNISYILSSATQLSAALFVNGRPNKVCMLTSLQYFTAQRLDHLLTILAKVTEPSAPLYFSDVPDVECLYRFYDTPERRADYERRRAAGTEAIGTWWSRHHLAEILKRHDYVIEFREQDRRRLGVHYRFDFLARPRQNRAG